MHLGYFKNRAGGLGNSTCRHLHDYGYLLSSSHVFNRIFSAERLFCSCENVQTIAGVELLEIYK